MKQLPQPDPRGWLALTGLNNDDLAAELATQAADNDKAINPATMWRPFDSLIEQRQIRAFTRPATPTEKRLLARLGYQWPDYEDPLYTAVHYRTKNVRYRFWPQLEKEYL
ncbi:hypothetical protein QP921_05585 [Corynebacterium pseudodiphtheriticum]|uniref:hypothetical protein n=1 Tax=Corynebacterium pseudodiphtheriticum TaxID=37637 RepID=UPI001EF66AB8|nr:hypothetical protein [Corynebacterium pseudodiphtheriticum]MCG7252597.1 hypothetical protein [Corynebacterium pseudodiphtheriticum]MDC7088514.1 hypothetical protein [Corynebacterium pseudodiphtheriticum]MDK4320837.1 hypothetical protein [Corynebacterium pseudodiphtheriticum]MDK8577860.1 hypothetical protein [Corynebacterium pseudodiphtheriticum]MDK8761218.1 hypothetical protein [Corynebacterium pseudodiphtheriticum]